MRVPSSTKAHGPAANLQEFLDQKAIANPEQTAEELLTYDEETQELVGVHSSGKQAFYVNHGSNAIIAVLLSENTLEPNGLVVPKLTDSDNVGGWVRKFNVCLGWLHPRHR